ncbi:hypothetical protein LV779_36245 [Streptomyces thinghirensis]|nr:hypothetical protein [Streptomyces thinghirensis]
MDDAAFQQLLLREEDLEEVVLRRGAERRLRSRLRLRRRVGAGHRRPDQHAHARHASRDGAPRLRAVHERRGIGGVPPCRPVRPRDLPADLPGAVRCGTHLRAVPDGTQRRRAARHLKGGPGACRARRRRLSWCGGCPPSTTSASRPPG